MKNESSERASGVPLTDDPYFNLLHVARDLRVHCGLPHMADRLEREIERAALAASPQSAIGAPPADTLSLRLQLINLLPKDEEVRQCTVPVDLLWEVVSSLTPADDSAALASRAEGASEPSPVEQWVSCMDCDPCLGGRPDQCAVGGWPAASEPTQALTERIASIIDKHDRPKGIDVDAAARDIAAALSRAEGASATRSPTVTRASTMSSEVGRYRVADGRVVEWEIDNCAAERADGTYTLYAPAGTSEPSPEPVAWLLTWLDDGDQELRWERPDPADFDCPVRVDALYTATGAPETDALDAARYRYLRDADAYFQDGRPFRLDVTHWDEDGGHTGHRIRGEPLDAAIDSALAKERGTTQGDDR